MRISTNVGIGIDRPRTIAEIVEEARRAADLGLGGAWWAERHTADALTSATVAGLAVPGLPLGTAVVTTYPRHPLALASQALTVQAATGNRLTLGIGPGHKHQVETALGMDYDRPAQHSREYLSALVPLLHGEQVEFDGEIHHVSGQIRTPGARPPSVLLAALGPVMLRTAGELADGTVTVWTGVRTVAEHVVPLITASAESAGRPAPKVVVNLPIAVTDDPDGARSWIAEHFGASRRVPRYRALFEREGVGGAEDIAVVGDERQVEKGLRRFADAGATEFIAVPFGPEEQITRTLTALGALNRTE
ncbi:TIGR03564 family F420-dependent LLM class oxidoreductase [Actinomadura harenae]|uniref:TIGR03564 family F420-dependent LLM class oxidoreductase n=1 Tax=Actinomadura harenae TaxID=2483351 RepID=A0A3M2M9Y7_9ACTN|nr:TIGR03564 family F420-dependent LLM class oxidoreductase [Actinomadura harenae]RMI46289.1 TIGR03564 family F420-dependent LLM class oxidoreductase [Actinomadura harenae]